MAVKQKAKTATPSRKQAAENPAPVRVGIHDINIRGFKSLESASLPLSSVNVLVGANGTGKSNFLKFFEMLVWLAEGRSLGLFAAINGGGGDLLFNGAKHTPFMHANLNFLGARGELHGYRITLQHSHDDRLFFASETWFRVGKRGVRVQSNPLRDGRDEAKIATRTGDLAKSIRETLKGCGIYQFHDTTPEGPFHKDWDAGDTAFLRHDGGNLAPVLLDLRENHPRIYAEIERIIGYALPVFAGFDLHIKYGKVALRWHGKGKGKTFGAHLTSDGTLRLMALIILLNMPNERVPDVLLLDEPELGMHPYAISLLGALIKRRGIDKQIIVATQSPLLVNEFKPEDVVVTEINERGATSFKRLKTRELTHWLEEFQLGELWQKNVIGGNPQ